MIKWNPVTEINCDSDTIPRLGTFRGRVGNSFPRHTSLQGAYLLLGGKQMTPRNVNECASNRGPNAQEKFGEVTLPTTHCHVGTW